MPILKATTVLACSLLMLNSLQQRSAFANNVDVVFATPVLLQITGDTDSNHIRIEETAPNVITVTGLGGTTVNSGITPVMMAAPVIEMVFARMGDGDDKVGVMNLSLDDNQNGQLYVEGGDGEDRVGLYNVQTRVSITVDTGQHDDMVRSYLTTTRHYRIATGAGNDGVAVEMFNVGSMKITSDEGDDFMRANTGTVHMDMAMSSGVDDDVIQVWNVDVYRDLTVSSWNGDDEIDVDFSNVGRSMSVLTAGGDDWLIMTNTMISDSLKVDTGQGNDLVGMIAVDAGNVGVATFDGDDRVYLLAVFTATSLHVFQSDGEDQLFVQYCTSLSPEFHGGPGQDKFYIRPNSFPAPSVSYASSYEIWIP